MPQKPTPPWWVHRVNELIAEIERTERASARKVSERLPAIDATAPAPLQGQYPSPRTVQRLLEAYRRLDDRAKAEYGAFNWPGSMEAGLLPWEASRIGLDLLRAYNAVGASRPSVNRVRWNWRLSCAAPSMKLLERDLRVTMILFADERTFQRLEEELANWEASDAASE